MPFPNKHGDTRPTAKPQPGPEQKYNKTTPRRVGPQSDPTRALTANRRRVYEDELPAFPGARFPLSAVPRTDFVGSRAYFVAHPGSKTVRAEDGSRVSPGFYNKTVRAEDGSRVSPGFYNTPDLGNAVHIHLHGGAPDMTANYSKIAKKMRKRK